MAEDKSFSQLVEQMKSLNSSAKGHYSSVNSDVINLIGEIRRCRTEIRRLEKYISEKEEAHSARKAEYDQAKAEASHYRSLASDYYSEYYDDDDDESDNSYLLRMAEEAEAKAAAAEDRAQDILGDMLILEQEIKAAQGEISGLNAEISGYRRNLSTISEKCHEAARRMNRSGMIVQVRASEVNNKARPAFSAGGSTKFGSRSRFAEAWCSKQAQEGHNVGVEAVNMGKKFEDLAQTASANASSGDDSVSDNRRNHEREERQLGD